MFTAFLLDVLNRFMVFSVFLMLLLLGRTVRSSARKTREIGSKHFQAVSILPLPEDTLSDVSLLRFQARSGSYSLVFAASRCSKVEKKRYFSLMLLCGFTGFDGSNW